MPFDRRRLLLLVVAAAPLALLLAGEDPDEARQAAASGATALSPAPAAQRADPYETLPRRRPIGKAGEGDAFGPRSWAPPPPPPSRAKREPAPPQAPPNPFRFGGTTLHGGKLKTFLLDGERVYEARPGEELDRGYRVESVSPEQIVLVYMPLGIRYTIEAGSALNAPAPSPPQAAKAPRPAAPPRRRTSRPHSFRLR
jgi:hypothetical protein